jgi:hypothetical protein
MRAEIIKVDDKTHRLMLGKHELGVSKTDFDARFHMHAINDALEVAFLEGQRYLERMVENQRMELELQKEMQKARAEIEEARLKLSNRTANPPYTTEVWSAAKPEDGEPCPKCGARVQGCPEGEYCSWIDCDYVA